MSHENQFLTQKDLTGFNDFCSIIPTDALETILSNLKDELHKRDDADSLYDVWHLDDIKNRRPDLSDDQCREILQFINHHHDAEIGINWDSIDCAANALFPEPDSIHS